MNCRKSGSVPLKVVVFGQKWMYSGKNGCVRAKVVIFSKMELFR